VRVTARGLSLVELMVGIAVGLFITAAAAMLVSSQLTENRRLLVETQIQQDLRATADIVTRDLRRASYAANASTFVAVPGSSNPPLASWAAEIAQSAHPTAPDADYSYSRGASPQFSLRLDGGVVQRRIGNGNWQPLTDRNVLEITAFDITQSATDVPLACPRLCPAPASDESCWPKLQVRDLSIRIAGRSATDPGVQREIRSNVRVRNDVVAFAAAGQPVCP
jgi:type IV pilus assembly protein PilW